MDFQKIESFVVLAETGRHLDAADKLFISQSTLSKQISALERELGVDLFKKTKRGSELTQAGWEFYAYSKRALQELHDVTRKLDQLKGSSVSTVHVGSLPVWQEYGIVDAVNAYWARNHSVHVDYVERNQDGLLEALERHDIDVAFARMDLIDQSRFDFIPVMEDELVYICSTKHHMPRGEAIRLESIRNEDFILLEGASGITQLFTHTCGEHGFFPHIIMSYPRHHAVFGLVRKDAGVTVIPRRTLIAFGDEGMVSKPFEEPLISRLGFIWLKRAQLTKHTQDFIHGVIEELGGPLEKG